MCQVLNNAEFIIHNAKFLGEKSLPCATLRCVAPHSTGDTPVTLPRSIPALTPFSSEQLTLQLQSLPQGITCILCQNFSLNCVNFTQCGQNEARKWVKYWHRYTWKLFAAKVILSKRKGLFSTELLKFSLQILKCNCIIFFHWLHICGRNLF